MKHLLTSLVVLVLVSGVAAADTVQFARAEVTVPDDGWTVQTEDGLMTLALEKGGAIVELYDFSKVPAADKAKLAALIGDRKDTSDVEITLVDKLAQHGLKGIGFSGLAQIRTTKVALVGVAFKVGKRAVVAIAFVRPDADDKGRNQVFEIVQSIKAAR